MSTTTLTIVCGNCRTPVGAPEDAAPHDQVSCTTCGQTDTVEDVYASAKASVIQDVRGQVTDTLRDIAGRSKFISFKPGGTSTEQFRWVCEERGE